MKLPSLYEIKSEYVQALEELVDMDDEAVVDTLDALKGELEVKATSVAAYTLNLDATVNAMKEAEKRMAERRKAIENKMAQIKEYIKESMEDARIFKIETPEMKLSISKNPAKVEVIDEELVPDEYKTEKVTVVLDKKELKAALNNGGVDGAVLTQSTRLNIK